MKTKLDELREVLFDLYKQRDEITAKRGESAQDNKDLRENSVFLRLDEQYNLISRQINDLIAEIYLLSPRYSGKKKKILKKKV